MSDMFGGFGEGPLREAVIGAPLQTFQRAVADLFDEVDDLRAALVLMAHRTPWDDQPCWCVISPFDDGSNKTWRHDARCLEIKELFP